MRSPSLNLTLLCILLLSLILPVAVAASDDIIVVNLQSLNVMQPLTYKVFDDDGNMVLSGSTDNLTESSIPMNYTSSNYYTVQFQPTAGTMDTGTMAETLLSWFTQYGLIICLVIAVIIGLKVLL
jgi:hypothetical protein